MLLWSCRIYPFCKISGNDGSLTRLYNIFYFCGCTVEEKPIWNPRLICKFSWYYLIAWNKCFILNQNLAQRSDLQTSQKGSRSTCLYSPKVSRLSLGSSKFPLPPVIFSGTGFKVKDPSMTHLQEVLLQHSLVHGPVYRFLDELKFLP